MAKIQSFKRNHNEIDSGLYLQETKRNIDIYDLRFVKPNTGTIPIDAMHTIEHMFATWLKTESDIKEQVVSFNPAGCQTMFYLELFNDKDVNVKQQLIKCIEWCLKQDKVIGATKEECGNYASHDLTMAQYWLKRYKEVLLD